MELTPQAAAQELLRRQAARNGLIPFTQFTKPDFQPGAHHHIIADALERVERGQCRRLIIEAPPRHTKSELGSRRFPAWYLGRHPTRQIITATYASDFAQDFGRDVREIVKSEAYQQLFHMQLASDSTAKWRWHTDSDGVYVATGVDGQVTGRGAHVALIDDPFKNRQDADSETQRETVWRWYTSTLRPRLMSYEDAELGRIQGAIVLICTRWHEDDLAGRLLEAAKTGGEEWEVIQLPAIRFKNGEEKALWPEWYPLTELRSIQAAIGPRDWLSLYQQTPTAEAGTYFKREWFDPQRYSVIPENLSIYMSGDFAVTEGDGDFTEIAVWGIDHADNIYALDWYSGQVTADAWTQAILDRVDRWKPEWFVGETGPIRRAVEPFLMKAMTDRKAYVMVEWLPHGTANKEANARSFQALASVGKVHFPHTEWAERVIDQLLRFPSGKHDDAVDACSLFGRMLEQTWGAPKKAKKASIDWSAPPELRIADFEPRGSSYA